jgi:hypothetical protein
MIIDPSTISDEQLRTLCIFDLTDDKDILEEQLGDITREEHLEGGEIFSRISAMQGYAEAINDKELLERIERIFEPELSTFGFE